MKRVLPLAVALVLTSPCHTFGASLKIGDPAPPLTVSRWVQGEPVAAFEKDKAYIVEFWATWCGPCRTSIPHLNELHAQFKEKGLVVIGQDVWEREIEQVEPFVKQMGARMTYRVALDSPEGLMAKNWMEAAEQTGIPTAFVVDRGGTIAWIGHPTKLTPTLIEQVLEGKFDLARANTEYQALQAMEERVSALWNDLYRHKKAAQWEQAQATLDQLEKVLPKDEQSVVTIARFNCWLDQKDYQAAYQVAERFAVEHPEDGSAQNELAWSIVIRQGLPERNLSLAEKLARQANRATQGQDSEILDTLARVLFLSGQKKEAIDLQQKATELAAPSRKTQYQRLLTHYQDAQPPNEKQIARLQDELDQALQEQAWDKAKATWAQLESQLMPDQKNQAGSQRFHDLLENHKYKSAYRMAELLSESFNDAPMYQNQLAWEIATREGLQERDLDVAEKIARRAYDTTAGENAEILDTLARVLFLKGEKPAAIAMQEKAVEHARGRRKDQFQETLSSYQDGKEPKPY